MLMLDSEALSVVAHRSPARRHNSVRALISRARVEGQEVATSAAVLAEVIRGRPRGAAVHGVLRRERVRIIDVDKAIGARAGHLLGAVRAGSELAVDALVVACADLAGGAVIATVDGTDLRRLAAHAARVQVADVG
jgi:predicted nucleic acid-binding protein